MTTRTNIEQVAKEAGRAFLHEAASARGLTTETFVSRLVNGLERAHDPSEKVHSELLFAMALTIPVEQADGRTLELWRTIERWGAEVEDELRGRAEAASAPLPR